MKLKLKIFILTLGLCLVIPSFLAAFENNAEDSLSKGKRLYADGRYEEAMDAFIDVFVSGNTDQIAEANEYVNLIHFDRGGVVAPKQVPYDADLERRQNIGVIGDDMFGKPKKNAKDTKSVKDYTEIWVKNEIEDIAEPPESIPEADPFGYSKSGKANTTVTTVTQTREEISEEKYPHEQGLIGNLEEETELSLKDTAEYKSEESIVSGETSFPKGSKSKVRSLQKKKEKQQRQDLIEYIIERLNANEDVQVYMRAGRVDAIDMNSAAIFQGNKIDKGASSILDDVLALMVLENSPAYVILPEGSYTDDVTLHGVRQAVALNSYFINRGISSSKMNLNMGLTTQEPPEKFSNLAGISIVFDYKGKSRLKSKLQEKNLPPVLSLVTYPFKEITPSADETFVIDFSVMEASAPVKDWTLQIVSHAADDHYYVVKQLSGEGPLNYQTFWNGHKRYFGQVLPYGKYTVVLKAKDTEGRESIVKRQVILNEPPEKKEEVVIVKTESEVLVSEQLKKAKEGAKTSKTSFSYSEEVEVSNLDYSQKRLWNKPGRKQVGEITEEVTEEVTESAPVVSAQTQETVYEKTTTTNNTVTVSNEVESNSEENSYGAANPYESPEAGEESNPYEF